MKIWRQIYDRYQGCADTRQTERRIELVTIGLAILLLVQLLLSGLRLAILSTPDAISPSVDGLSDAQLMSVERVSSSQSAEISARPLFWLSRRPSEVTVAADAPGDNPTANLGSLEKVKLLGLFGSGETAGIIVLVDKKKSRILLGGQVEGWTVDSIQRNDVEFTNGARREKLVLLPQSSVAVPPGSADQGQVPAPREGGDAAIKVQDTAPVAAPAGDGNETGASSPSLGFGGGSVR
jgi:hypothetical protein